MKFASEGYRVAVVGGSSLQGKELLAVFQERTFPVSRLVTFDPEEEEPGLPILDLQQGLEAIPAEETLKETELDFAFLAAPLETLRANDDGARPFLRSAKRLASATHCVVIDMCGCLANEPGGVLRVPMLERSNEAARLRQAGGRDDLAKFFVSIHPAAIVLSSLLLRFAAKFEVKNAVAQVFGPASEIGANAIEELQKQTVSLLSFQKIPKAVFGMQLAFNLLPPAGAGQAPQRRGRAGAGRHGLAGYLTETENLVRNQLQMYLSDRVPAPALRFLQAPVFHSTAFSLYVETAKPADPPTIAEALQGDRIHLRHAAEQAPSPVEVTGTSDILVGAVQRDSARPEGFWVWAVADNLRIAAVNAVEIAETLPG